MKEISRESVTIEWKPPLDDGGLELTKYAIEKHEPETDQWVKVADVDKSVETYCIQRLNENCEYMFRIMAQNPIGFSEALESEPIVIKTALGKYNSLIKLVIEFSDYPLVPLPLFYYAPGPNISTFCKCKVPLFVLCDTHKQYYYQ